MRKKRLKHVLEIYEEAYQVTEALEQHKAKENLLDKVIAGYRVKSIWSGNMLEIEAYPIWHIPQKKRVKQNKDSSKAQKKLNEKNKQKHLWRLLNVNFTRNQDLYLTLTYQNCHLPVDHTAAKRDMQNYIRRLKHWLKKQKKYAKFDLKYIYVTEHTREDKQIRVHHHMVTNFPNKEKAKKLWNKGRMESQWLDDKGDGFKALAKYLLKEQGDKTTKSYTPSRNLKKPKITVSDTKLSRRRSAQIAREEIAAQEIFEKMYKHYQFRDMQVSFSDYVSGAYIQVEMIRIDTVETLVEMKRRLDI